MLNWCLKYFNQSKIKKDKQKGFTLIELMIAITVGTILTAGIVELMRITRQSYLLSTHLGDLLGNADAAITVLSRCATQAGHQSTYYTEPTDWPNWKFIQTKLWFGCFNDNSSSHAFLQTLPTSAVTGNAIVDCAIAAANKGFNSIGFMAYSLAGPDNVCYAGNNGGPFRYGPRNVSDCPMFNNSLQIYLLRGSGTVYAGAPFSGTYGGSGNMNDTLVITYEGQTSGSGATPTGVTVDCLGRIVAPNVLVVNTFKIQNDTMGHPFLACSVTSYNVSTKKTLGNTGFQPIAYGVEAFRVIYGVDTDPLPDGAPNEFVNASFFNSDTGNFTDIFGNVASNSSARVVGIQVALLMRTSRPISAIQDTKSYTLLNNTPIGPFNDNFIRKLYTVSLKTNECIPTARKDCGPGAEFYGWYPAYNSNGGGTTGFSGYISPGTTSGPNANEVIWSPPITLANVYPSYCGCQLDSQGGLRNWVRIGNNAPTGGTPAVSFYQTHYPQNQMQSAAGSKASCGSYCCCAFR